MNANPLLTWIDEPSTRQGIRFRQDGAWERWTYADLAGFAGKIAGGLAAAGVRHDERVVIIERTGPDFVATLYGVMLAGAIPCPVAPPYLFQNADLYARHLRAIIDVARPALVVTAANLVERLEFDGPVHTAAELAAAGGRADGPPAGAALLQFTSGSSGRVKGVRVPVAALAANVAAISTWLEMGEGDATASWLPVHHDMGLIGCLFTPVSRQRDLWLLEPAEFIRDPASYLACFGEHGATMTAMPPFGLEYIVRRLSALPLTGMDFSRWRALIVGAERIDVDVLDRFTALLAPAGFDRRALLPAYGLAEATLAVTGLALREEPTSLPVVPQEVRLGSPVTDGGDTVRPVVGCGRALDGVRVAVVDEDGVELPERHVGQIVVRGASLAEGYVRDGAATGRADDSPAGLTEWHEGALHTGDAGFLDGGQLFVIGRLGDAMKVRGRTLFAEDVESALVDAGVPRLRLTVLLGSSAGGATGVVLLERPTPEWAAAAEATLRRMTEHATTVVLDVPRRSIARTTSGKPKRREMWTAYVAGKLDAREILPPAGHDQDEVTTG
ncbi:AMP-binding protein [Microtetraspora malaysiensis]|uniref:AMP-binding protein n=1 Tax=Microtetraspora malaysiensis TaxID=161358 RepID=UPI000830BA88|nr:AMP-binding protein [Microtetraspora malaysiensis]